MVLRYLSSLPWQQARGHSLPQHRGQQRMSRCSQSKHCRRERYLIEKKFNLLITLILQNILILMKFLLSQRTEKWVKSQ